MKNLERLYPLADAVEKATGNRPHLSTVLRWCLHGAQGIVLESAMLGGRRLTSVESVGRFLEARTRASTPSHGIANLRTTTQRERDARAAERALSREGV